MPTEPVGVYRLVVDLPDDPSYVGDSYFILDDDAQEKAIPFLLFLCGQNRGEEARDLEYLGVIFCFMFYVYVLCFMSGTCGL